MHNYGFDRLGSVTAMTSTSGSLVNSYRYDPWGQPNGGTGAAYNPFQYTGTYKDTMTGLYQMGARYYQPGSGRFTQMDPLPESMMSINRYAYVSANPANKTDPTGLHEVGCYGETGAGTAFWGMYQALYLSSCAVEALLAPEVGVLSVEGIARYLGIELGSLSTALWFVGITIATLEAVNWAGGGHGVAIIFTYPLPFIIPQGH